MTTARKLSYLIFAAMLVGAVVLRLGEASLAGLFSYMILDLSYRRLSRHATKAAAKAASVAAFVVIAAVISWLFWLFIRLAMIRLPDILASVIPKIDELAGAHGVELPFENLHQFRGIVLGALKENARTVSQASSLLTKEFLQIIVAVFVAVSAFLGESGGGGASLFEAVRLEFDDRMTIFMGGFEKIFSAQVMISFINTGITAIFLLVMGIPHVHFLTLATFIFGIVPIIGNVASNSMVVGTALAISPRLAGITLIFLVIMHKAQYFLSGEIVGSRINTPVWQILLGMMIGEAVMGVPGMILAPVLLNYLREELQTFPAEGLTHSR